MKKCINPKTYIRYVKSKINKFTYNLANLETPHHDFIVLKKKTEKWKIDGYERVGEDWHIRVVRIKDNKAFLFDQPFFYFLQLNKNTKEDLENELFITYGVTPKSIKKMELVVEKLKL